MALGGLRLDAIKHYSASFLRDFVQHIDKTVGRDWFLVGEYWQEDSRLLAKYIEYMQHRISLFDVKLVCNFSLLSSSDEADLRTVFDKTLVLYKPNNAVVRATREPSLRETGYGMLTVSDIRCQPRYGKLRPLGSLSGVLENQIHNANNPPARWTVSRGGSNISIIAVIFACYICTLMNSNSDACCTLVHTACIQPHPPQSQRRHTLRILLGSVRIIWSASEARLQQFHSTHLRRCCAAPDDASPSILGLWEPDGLPRRAALHWLHANGPPFKVRWRRPGCPHDKFLGIPDQEDACGEATCRRAMDRRPQVVSWQRDYRLGRIRALSSGSPECVRVGEQHSRWARVRRHICLVSFPMPCVPGSSMKLRGCPY